MRYKNNILDKLTQLEATASKIQFQINRGLDQESILESIESLKEQIEKTVKEINFLKNNPKKEEPNTKKDKSSDAGLTDYQIQITQIIWIPYLHKIFILRKRIMFMGFIY